MMRIQSGQVCSLVELFSGSTRMVIPDLQRDYCWGETKDLAKNFLQSIIELYEKGEGNFKQVSLGILYAYENPKGFINIADGQQRLTTIFLIQCLLYRRLSQVPKYKDSEVLKALKNFLVLDENKKVKEPRLRYEVRESTSYFLKDFLNDWVLADDVAISADKLVDAPWYRAEYENDPTAKSMLKALKELGRGLNGLSDGDLESLVWFILGRVPESGMGKPKITKRLEGVKNLDIAARLCQGFAGINFVYFDVVDRDFGEKMYVIINTRGAPMEGNEHIKAKLLASVETKDEEETLVKNQEYWATIWEGWQDFFWVNRLKGESTGDEGFDEFLNWVAKIESKNEKVDTYQFFAELNDDNTFEELRSYFEQVKELWDYCQEEAFKKIFTQIDQNKIDPRSMNKELILLPLLAFMKKFPKEKNSHYQFLRRLRKNFFDKERNYRRDNFIPGKDILSIVENAGSLEEILRSEVWYSEEEKIKDALFPDRYIWSVQDEYKLWSWEDHDHFSGDLTALFYVSGLNGQTLRDFGNQVDATQEKFEAYEGFFSKNSQYMVMYSYQAMKNIWVKQGTPSGKVSQRLIKKEEYFDHFQDNEGFLKEWKNASSADELYRNLMCLNRKLFVDVVVSFNVEARKKSGVDITFENGVFVVHEFSLENNRCFNTSVFLVKFWVYLESLKEFMEPTGIDFSKLLKNAQRGIASYEWPLNQNRIDNSNNKVDLSARVSLDEFCCGVTFLKQSNLFEYKFPLMKQIRGKEKVLSDLLKKDGWDVR